LLVSGSSEALKQLDERRHCHPGSPAFGEHASDIVVFIRLIYIHIVLIEDCRLREVVVGRQ
jgi:hypothetical protein